MLIKTGYPNLLHGYDIFCFNLMNYWRVWENELKPLRELFIVTCPRFSIGSEKLIFQRRGVLERHVKWLYDFCPQKFQKEVGDISLVTTVLATDLSDPNLDDKTRAKLKDINSRWKGAWNWSEDRNQKLTKAMIDWQKFRDEELILLNWLGQKEKTLKEVANTDVADEEQVKESLELLEVILISSK